MDMPPPLDAYGIHSDWFRTGPARHTLLVVYAHPDDESFGNAGTLARYSALGVAVHYVCATRGESGEVTPTALGAYPDVAALRTAELTCAAQALGLRAVHYLGYRDSGMAGTPANEDPAAFVQAPVDQVAGQIVALMRALRPQVVLTFGPYGGYGHPDHIHTHRATLAAFRAAGDATCYPEQVSAGLEPYRPRKLYYNTFSFRLLKPLVGLLHLIGRDLSRFGQNGDVDLERAIAEATPVTTVVSTSAYLPQIERAWRCHASQLAGMGALAGAPWPLRRLFIRSEHFTRVIPPRPARRRPERDLFAGLYR